MGLWKVPRCHPLLLVRRSPAVTRSSGGDFKVVGEGRKEGAQGGGVKWEGETDGGRGGAQDGAGRHKSIVL